MKKYEVNSSLISEHYRIKCIMIGDTNVGKSTITSLLATNNIDPRITSTIGIAFATKEIVLDKYGQKITVQLWDTAGQERYSAIVNSYMRDVGIAFLVYDVTNINSWNNLVTWRAKLDKYKKYNNIPLIILVGCKTDLRDHQVTQEDLDRRTEEWGCISYTISCQQSNSLNLINRMFYKAVEQYHEAILNLDENGNDIPLTVKNIHKMFTLKKEASNLPKCCLK